MGQISKQLFFKAPLTRVWEIWTNVEKTPDWVDGVRESTITSRVRTGPGLCWSEKCIFGNRLVDLAHKIVIWEEQKKTVIRTGLPVGGTLERIAEFREEKGDQTEVKMLLEWEIGVMGAFIAPDEVEQLMEKSFEKTAQKWKWLAEH